MSPITWVRERVHRTCTTLITCQHDALVDSAQAHHEAEQALVAERARARLLEEVLESVKADREELTERLEAEQTEVGFLGEELARARAEVDQADAARREMVQALAALLGGDPAAQEQTERLREQEDLHVLLDRFFEVGAIRSGLEHLLVCPRSEVGEHLEAAARRLIEHSNDRSRELRELASTEQAEVGR
jgi:septation ring formation regulator EzrA